MLAVNCVHIFTWGEINAVDQLDENDIIIRNVTYKIQQMSACGNQENTINLAKDEDERRGNITLG